MRKYFLALFLMICFLPIAAQNWQKEANRVCDSMIHYFWGASFRGAEHQFYFNRMGNQQSMKNEWWWQAHAMDVIIDAYERTGDERYLWFYDAWYEGIIGANYEHFDDDVLHNNSIDDMEWICITLIRMTETSGDERYLEHARKLFNEYIITTWGPDDEAPWHGGVSWSTDEKINKSKNACSNGPAGIIAYMLARNAEVGSDRVTREQYIMQLKRIYDWERKYLFDEDTGVVADHINRKGETPQHHLTYNAGTFIACAGYLLKESGDEQYVKDIAKCYERTLQDCGVGEKHLLSFLDRKEQGSDHGVFNGIFFRYVAELLNAHLLPQDMQTAYSQYLKENARKALACLDDNLSLFSRDWENIIITNPSQAALPSHISGATLLAAVASLK